MRVYQVWERHCLDSHLALLDAMETGTISSVTPRLVGTYLREQAAQTAKNQAETMPGTSRWIEPLHLHE